MKIEELKFAGQLHEFTRAEQMQMAKWLDYYMERDGSGGPGVIESARRVVNRASQGSIWPVSVAAVGRLIDVDGGLRSGLPLNQQHVDEVVAKRLTDFGPFQLLDNCFMVYGDGSIMVGYDTTGFIVAHDAPSMIMHPETRFAFQLTELDYDLSFGAKVIHDGAELPITGRTLFFYRLVQACCAILESAPCDGAAA